MATPYRVRRSLGGALLTLLAACGGDSPAGPDGGTSGATPAALSIPSPNVRTLEIATVGVRGTTLPASVLDGRFGGQVIKATRLDDTTLAFVVPQVAAGQHEVRFDIATKSFSTKVQVTVAPPVGDPAAYFDQVIGTLTTEAAAIEAHLAATPDATPATDTLGLGAVAQKLRWAADSARRTIDRMSAADRAAAATYLSVNAEALGLVAASATAGAPSLLTAPSALSNPCADKDTKACNAYLKVQWDGIKARIATCTIQAGKFAGIGTLAGGALGSLFGGIGAAPGAAIGALLGGVAGAAMCVNDINDAALSNMIVPAITHLKTAVAGPEFEVVPTTTYYTVNESRRVEVVAEVRSFIASDVTLPGTEGAIARTISESAGLWATLMQKTGLSVAGPRLPATPAVSVLRDMPASMLKIGTISLAGVTATTAGDDTTFRVTFANEKQGADHPITYAVRYEPEGRPVEEVSLDGVLQPARYVVAQIEVDSVPEELRVGFGSKRLHFVATDSSGRFLGATGVDSLLDGRTPQWTSDATGIATVDADGVVTPKGEGMVTITARLEGGSVSVTIPVYPDVVGTWTLKTLNGKQVPYSETDSLGVTNVGGGTIALSRDSTFTFGYSETWTANVDGKVWDEGGAGHGTYVLRGNSIVFTILEKSGEKVEELVGAGFSDGVLTVTYSGGEGSATGRLTKG